MLAFVQAVNSVRLVLGTMLDVSEDDESGLLDDDVAADDSPEYHLYAYLSWVLDASSGPSSGSLPDVSRPRAPTAGGSGQALLLLSRCSQLDERA